MANLLKRASNIAEGISEIGKSPAFGLLGKAGGHAVIGGMKGAATVANKGLEVGENIIKNVGKVSKQDIKNGTKKMVRNTLTDDSSYKAITKSGRIQASLKSNTMDAMRDELRNAGNVAAYVGSKTLKANDNALFGVSANKLGVGLALTGAAVSGVPEAGKQFVQGRQGTNADQMPVTSTPRTPAYAQNGGATGDLVFALNNLRNGGFM